VLSDLRVIEISEPPTMLAGQLLGDLGADVLLVEPPSGAAGRRMEPFAGGIPGLERSLVWQALNRNKRGITLDRHTADGRAILDTLLAKADVLLEAPPPGGTPLDLAPELAETLIHCVVWPFAESGPKSDYAVSDRPGQHRRPRPATVPVPRAAVDHGGLWRGGHRRAGGAPCPRP
jgi:benzylsuccinate CoA-transferase BbsE subunit